VTEIGDRSRDFGLLVGLLRSHSLPIRMGGEQLEDLAVGEVHQLAGGYVDADGSLEFSGPPPALVGYRQEGRRRSPSWPPCVLRMLPVQVFDGVLNIAGICVNPRPSDSATKSRWTSAGIARYPCPDASPQMIARPRPFCKSRRCRTDTREPPTGRSDAVFAVLKSDRMSVVQAALAPAGVTPP
jgi:hypothetical protein